MPEHTQTIPVLGPWSLDTSRRFWEGFAPSALPQGFEGIQTTFRVEADGSAARTHVTQIGDRARITVRGDGDLGQAARQVARFLSLDIDARQWPAIGDRDAIIGRAQSAFPGLRPCGFHSPYEAAAWAVLSQRVRIPMAARLRAEITERHGEGGAFPAPARLATLELDLPGRKAEYLHNVAEAALDGRLDTLALRERSTEDAFAALLEIPGIGPFSAELILLRGAQAPDTLPQNEARLMKIVASEYGPDARLKEIGEAWRPLRTWAAVHLRALGEPGTRAEGGSRAGEGASAPVPDLPPDHRQRHHGVAKGGGVNE